MPFNNLHSFFRFTFRLNCVNNASIVVEKKESKPH